MSTKNITSKKDFLQANLAQRFKCTQAFVSLSLNDKRDSKRARAIREFVCGSKRARKAA